MSKTTTKQTEAWKEYHDQINNLIDKEGFKNCLQWPPILKAVFVGNAPHIRAKARILFQKKGDVFGNISNRNLAKDPEFGNPPLLPDYPFTSGARVNMLWHLRNLMLFGGEDLADYDSIFEFGGGVGTLCQMVHRLGFSGEYILYDVPAMNRIQKWYLERFAIRAEVISNIQPLKFPANEKSAFVGFMSFSEIPMKERKKIEPIIFQSDLICIAYATDYGGMDNSKYFAYLAERLNGYEIKISDIDPWRQGKKYFFAKRKSEQ